jgi:histidinol-phosphatase (PHP family)
MVLFDNHNHSQFSFDGKGTTVEISARSAISRGLGGIAFTDHCDYYIPTFKSAYESIVPEQFDIKAQQEEIDRVKEILCKDNDFKILKGIEVGMYEECREEIRKTLTDNSFDQIIASVHYLENSDPYYGGYFKDKDCRQAYGNYLETIYKEAVALKDFDIIGHYDYVARYAPYAEASIRYKEFSDIFDSIFRFLIENGKGLEINTKSCTGSKGRKTPVDLDVLIRYREMGGEIISLGSDSHSAIYVGEGFEEAAEMLRSLGFRWSSHYEKRQLVQLPL